MLHKASKVRGYHLHATDGPIGHVDDFLMDEDWTVRYLVVDTSNFIGGKTVIISSRDIDRIDSPGKTIYLRLTREDVKRATPLENANVELIETLPPTII